MRILIAEDDPVSRRVLETFLRKWGYDVTSCQDGAQATRALQQPNAPSLAILDWMMPEMSGVDICRSIRAASRTLYSYLLILTAKSRKEDILAALEAGADDYLTKPFDPRELQARLLVGKRILDLQNELLRAKSSLEYQAYHDALTGIFNRREILNILEREVLRRERDRGSLGVVLADIDWFKNVNDSFGHEAGDDVLQETCRRIQSSLRPYDSVGRFGGEEFLLVVPSSSEAATLGAAERVRNALQAGPFHLPAAEIRVSLSLGIACVNSSQRLDARSAIRAADAALYRAKAAGRNCCVVASPADYLLTAPAVREGQPA
ncbi:MAG: GGDEF domain-containing response regulator [Candidatus Acidiferrales bacterium]